MIFDESIPKRQHQILPHIHQKIRNRCKNNYICVWRRLLEKKKPCFKNNNNNKNLRGVATTPLKRVKIKQISRFGKLKLIQRKKRTKNKPKKQTNKQNKTKTKAKIIKPQKQPKQKRKQSKRNKQNEIISLILTNP